MKSLVAFAFLATLALAASNGPSDRIVGGEETAPHAYPYIVSLRTRKYLFGIIPVSSQCGATILNDRWILTAAHCVDGGESSEVILGAHDISNPSETGQVHITSEELFVHEGYGQEQGIENDIGLVKLPQSITFTDNIQPVEWARQVPESGELARAIGWGITNDGDALSSDVLRTVGNLPVVSNEECRETYGEALFEETICIDSAGGRGVCSGDSGGPLVLESTGVQFGIASFVHADGCESGKAHGFTRVDYYADWIAEKMAENP